MKRRLSVCAILLHLHVSAGSSSWKRSEFHDEFTIPDAEDPTSITTTTEDIEDIVAPEEVEPILLSDYIQESKGREDRQRVVIVTKETADLPGLFPRRPSSSTALVAREARRSDALRRTTPIDPFAPRKERRGRLEIEFPVNGPNERSPQKDAEVSITASDLGMIALIAQGSGATLNAIVGTLRLLTPLVVARRGLARVGNVGYDWYTGRTLRTTFNKYERNYWNYYQGSAFLRTYSRIIVHIALLFALGGIFERGIYKFNQYPCLAESNGCNIWCALLWMGSVIGLGRIGSILITSYGHLRLQERQPKKIRLWHGLFDPEQWLKQFDTHEVEDPTIPFDPKPILFPATWRPLRAVLILAMAVEMGRSNDSMHTIMRQVVVQHVFCDEWYRTFIQEKRITVGMTVSWFYLMTTLRLFWTAANVGTISALMVVPSVLAVLVTSWMNIFLYFERKRRGRSILVRGKRSEKDEQDARVNEVVTMTTSSSKLVSLG